MSPPHRPVDIVVVLHDLALGGTERVAVRLAGAWARRGRRVRLVCGDARGPTAAWLDPAVELVPCAPALPRGPGSRTRLGQALAAELRRRPAGVLFVPGNFHWPVVRAAAALPGAVRPLVVAQVSNPLRRPDRGLLRRAGLAARARRELAGADALVTLTAEEAHRADRLFGRSPSQPLAHHLPLPALDDDAQASSPPPVGPPLVLCLGRLAPQKAFDGALQAFARLKRGDARLVFVGDGPERAYLARLARRLRVEARVEFAGTSEAVRPWLDRARVLLVPSRFEGYGAVVVEALAAGRPVVASDRVPAAVELVRTPDRGAVVRFGDADAAAAALRRVLAGPPPRPDPEGLERFRLGPAAGAHLALFDSLSAGSGG